MIRIPSVRSQPSYRCYINSRPHPVKETCNKRRANNYEVGWLPDPTFLRAVARSDVNSSKLATCFSDEWQMTGRMTLFLSLTDRSVALWSRSSSGGIFVGTGRQLYLSLVVGLRTVHRWKKWCTFFPSYVYYEKSIR